MNTYICKYYDEERKETGNTLEIMGEETLSHARERIKKNAKEGDVYYNIFTPRNNKVSSREMKL